MLPNTNILTGVAATLFVTMLQVPAFSKAETTTVDYRRSSLHRMLVASDENNTQVLKAFENAPFPTKYNNHMIGNVSINHSKYSITDADKAHYDSLVGEGIEIEGVAADEELGYKILSYLENEKVGNTLVAKWFNFDSAMSSYNSKLIEDRGAFDASFLERKIANSSSDGEAILKTAGFDLIPKTFVVVNRFNLVSNEIAATIARKAAKIAAGKIPNAAISESVSIAADVAYEIARKGYQLYANSFLFQLVWDDVAANEFYTNHWIYDTDSEEVKAQKLEAFKNSNAYQLQYVGKQVGVSLAMPQGGTFSADPEAQNVIDRATYRAIDKSFAKLQREYEAFQVKTPIYSVEPITAKIGAKEGLEGGEKFIVLEQVMDPENGSISYNKVAKVKVDKKGVWNNVYGAGEGSEEEENEETATEEDTLEATVFKGKSKDLFPGMLLQQVK